MTLPPPLDLILGTPQTAAALINALTDGIVDDDRLPRDTALRWVCDRVTDSDPILLAAPGQVWVRRDDTDPDDAPAAELLVRGRLADPPRVIVTELDSDPVLTKAEVDFLEQAGQDLGRVELGIAALDSYQLASWDPDDSGFIPAINRQNR